jgi:hypothetical protein
MACPVFWFPKGQAQRQTLGQLAIVEAGPSSCLRLSLHLFQSGPSCLCRGPLPSSLALSTLQTQALCSPVTNQPVSKPPGPQSHCSFSFPCFHTQCKSRICLPLLTTPWSSCQVYGAANPKDLRSDLQRGQTLACLTSCPPSRDTCFWLG